MNPTTIRLVISIFLIAHGLVTMSLATVPAPAPNALRTPYFPNWWRRDVDSTWPISKMGFTPAWIRVIGWVLWLIIMVLFITVGVGLIGFIQMIWIWRILAGIGAGLSLILIIFYWHPWLVPGIVINIAILLTSTFGWLEQWL